MSKLRCALGLFLFSGLISVNVMAGSVTFLLQDSQPKYFLDNPKMLGLCGDIYQSLQKQLTARGVDSRIDAHFLPIKRILNKVELEAGRVFCGSGRNAAREKRFSFAKVPVYRVSNVVVAHAADSVTPASLDDIKKNRDTVGALYGTSSARYLKEQLGEAFVNDSFSDLKTPLRLIGTSPSRLRYFYYHDLGLNYLVMKYDYPLRVVSTKFRTVPQWLIYSDKTSPEIKQAIEDSLRELKTSGELDQIVKQYIY